MNRVLIVAAALSLALTAVHVFGGGADVHAPLLQSDASAVNKGFVSVIWHAVTTNMLICTGALFVAAQAPRWRGVLVGIVLCQYGAFIALFLGYGLIRFSSVLVMPPWIGFAVICGVALLGLRPDRRGAV